MYLSIFVKIYFIMLIETNFKEEDFKFKYNISTRFRDLDPFNHVNNSVFLTYFENARRQFYERWNLNLNNRSLIVVSIKIDYLNELNHPSYCQVFQKIVRIGNTSFDILSMLCSNNIVICKSITTIVCYNFDKKNKAKVYEEIIDDFNK